MDINQFSILLECQLFWHSHLEGINSSNPNWILINAASYSNTNYSSILNWKPTISVILFGYQLIRHLTQILIIMFFIIISFINVQLLIITNSVKSLISRKKQSPLTFKRIINNYWDVKCLPEVYYRLTVPTSFVASTTSPASSKESFQI